MADGLYKAFVRTVRADDQETVASVTASPSWMASDLTSPDTAALVTTAPVPFVRDGDGWSAMLRASDDPGWLTGATPMPYEITYIFSAGPPTGCAECGGSSHWSTSSRVILLTEDLEELPLVPPGQQGWDLARHQEVPEGGPYPVPCLGPIELGTLTDVTAPVDTPAGKVLGTTAEGAWGPVDPPDSGVRQVESSPVEPTDPERLIWINTDAEPDEPEPVIMPGGVFAIHRGFINAGPIGAVAANSIYTWRVTIPGAPIIYNAFTTWRFWSTPGLGYSASIGSGIRAATAQVLHADASPGVLNITAHFPQAGTPDARAGAFEGISWMALTEADFS